MHATLGHDHISFPIQWFVLLECETALHVGKTSTVYYNPGVDPGGS